MLAFDLPPRRSARLFTLLATVILTLLTCAAASPMYAESSLARFPALMDTLVGGHYEAANQVARQIGVENPGHPASAYAEAVIHYTHMIDFEDSVGRGRFMELTNRCLTQARAWSAQGRGQAHELAYLAGSARSSRGLLLAHEGKVLSALRELIDARDAFDRAIELKPDFYDAYLGRGAYRYAVATNAKMLTWLPFMPSAEEGWTDMWLAVEHSQFSRYATLTSLVWFVLDNGNYRLADSICTAGLDRFPGSRTFLWPKLAVEYRQGHWQESIDWSQELLRQYLAHPDNNGYEAIGLYHKMMECADSLGRTEEAAGYARDGLATYRTVEVERRRQDKLDALRQRLTGKAGSD